MIADLELTRTLASYFEQHPLQLPSETRLDIRRKYKQGIRATVTVLEEDTPEALVARLYSTISHVIEMVTPDEASKVIFSMPFLYDGLSYSFVRENLRGREVYVPNPKTIKKACKAFNFGIVVFRMWEMDIDNATEIERVVARTYVCFDKGGIKMIRDNATPVTYQALITPQEDAVVIEEEAVALDN